MESVTYLNERDIALVRNISDKEASADAAIWYQDDRVRRLVSEIGIPLSEGVRLYVGVNCRKPVDADHLAAFLESLGFLKSAVDKDRKLCAAYQAHLPEDRATPPDIAIEIAGIILIALTTGAATRIGTYLADLLVGKMQTKKAATALMDMLLSSPIPSLLAGENSGLTADEIASKTRLRPEEVLCFLHRYEERGWIKREQTSAEDIWMLHRDNIKGYFGI